MRNALRRAKTRILRILSDLLDRLGIRRLPSVPPSSFDELYENESDPWGYRTSAYERDKYAETLKALGTRRFRRAAEFGCSIGVLSELLAEVCDELVAIDGSSVALGTARARVHRANVQFAKMRIPAETPVGTFDLLMVSEFLYYLNRSDIEVLALWCKQHLSDDALIVVVSWLGPLQDTPMDGRGASALIAKLLQPEMARTSSVSTDKYLLETLARV